jgi:hypothetical protein
MSLSANFPTTRPSLLLDFVNSGQMDPRITFSRASGATWFNSAGTLIGVDASSSSLTVGTGQQTLTLAATAGVDRGWIVGTSVLLSASTVTNTMTGVVVSYTASTQVLVVNVASVVGSGTYATWQVSNLMPRLDYNPSTLAAQGFLVEEARTNLCLQSEDWGSATWSKSGSTITANATTAPTGTTVADKLVEDTSTGTHITTQSISLGGSVDNSAYVISVFAKASERTRFQLFDNAQASSGITSFDLSNGTVVSGTGTITAVGNGWYRCSVFPLKSTSITSTLTIRLISTGSTTNYTGDGTSGIFVFGAQLEVGAFPTSYIPTTTTALTRAADVASVNTLSPWYNAAEGTLYVQAQDMSDAAHATSQPRAVSINDNTSSNTIDVSRIPASAQGRARVDVATVSQFNSLTTAWPLATQAKVALAYKENDFAACLGGGSVSTDALGTIPIVTRMAIGNLTTGNSWVGWIQRITYYPTRLSNAQLQAITA